VGVGVALGLGYTRSAGGEKSQTKPELKEQEIEKY